MRKLPHIQQPKNSNSCGAACLCMLYQHYGIPFEYGEIYTDVSDAFGTPPVRTCLSSKMVRNALNRKLIACCISCESIQDTMQRCIAAGIDVICLSHRTPNSFEGHYMLVSCIQGGSLYVNDPLFPSPDGVNKRIRFQTLERLSKSKGPNDQISTSNTLILIAKPPIQGRIVVVNQIDEGQKFQYPMFEEIVECARYTLNPFTDRWIDTNLLKI